jgi:curli biogenesis system outer membrane secretion channel CsgG
MAKPAIAQPAKQKKKIAIADFNFASTSDSSYWYSYRGNGAARGISELLINKLVNDGTYTIVSRSAVENYLRDNRITDPLDEATAVKAGKALGVDMVIVGTVTRFNVETRRAGGGIFGIGGSSETTKAIVQITARAIDTKTESIIAAMEGVGESSSSGASASIGIFSGGSSSSGSHDEKLSNAAEEAVGKIVEQVRKKL